MCEFLKPIVPIQMVQTNVCRNFSTISGASGYNKSVCLAHYSADRATALGFCLSNGMRLYTIANADDWNGLKNYTNLVYGTAGQVFHVNGERLANGSHVVSQPNAVPLYSPVKPTTSEKCLFYVSDWPVLDSQPCTNMRYVICEHVKPLPLPTAKTLPTNCFNALDLFYPNGNYYKTACRTPGGNNFTIIDAWCRASDMYPFGINSVDDVNYAIMFGRSIYGPTTVPIVHVGGVQSSNGTWFTYTPDPKPLYTGIPINGTGVSLTFTYNTAGMGSFEINNGSRLAETFCEFNRMA
jgi:hypothetical protein